jgi:uncharacterized glyoxalase superfamily protein PhnB
MTENSKTGWAAVYPHLRYYDPITSIDWLCRVFGFTEVFRMPRGGGDVVSRLEGPDGGLVMVSGISEDFKQWLRERVPNFRESVDRGWPYLSHAISMHVVDVDAHCSGAKAEGATMLSFPTNQPWGLRSYAALDVEGHQWEFATMLRTVEPEAWGAVRVLPRRR